MVWKMSIDLSRPLVNSMGHHDPLDGLITCLELCTSKGLAESHQTNLNVAISDFTQMCGQDRWATDDPLGIGGLLDDAVRLAQMVFLFGLQRRDLLVRLLHDARTSLGAFVRSSPLGQSPEHRLAFRELGLSIGLHGLERLAELAAQEPELADVARGLLAYRWLSDEIETLWSNPIYRNSRTWLDHCDINMVMLATSVAPDGYLTI
jgi:hypothetical protein